MKNRSPKIFAKIVFSVVCLSAWSPLWAQGQPFVELANGQRVPVERILTRPGGDLVVFREGQPTELARDQYIRAVGVRPETLDRANALIGRGDAQEAIPLLEEIVRQSAFQSWDVMAGISLANLQIDAGNPASAQRTVDQLKQRYGENAMELFQQLQQVEWRTRIATRNVSGLEEELTEIVRANEDRGKVAVALLTRGDLKHQRAELRPAILDYLRAVYFHRDNENVHAQALYKAGNTFKELGETANGRKYIDQLKQRYPNSEFAARAARD
ncbi:MAG: tetratricopeptide repeat protein [Kiritimatiellae bacterium]|nr:tetratricopeptide repeat protein [Kiritimatiellia bacterium]